METVELRFTPTAQDYVRTTRAFQLRMPQTRFLLGSMGFLILMMLCVEVSIITSVDPEIPTPTFLYFYPFLCIGVFAVYPILVFVVHPLTLTRQVMKNEQLHSEVRWQISDQEAIITGKHMESKLGWENFLEGIALKDYYLITYKVNKRMFQFIPKRAFESTEHEAAFRAMVEAHLGPIKK